MPRQSRGRSSVPSRSAPPPAPAQTRSSHTATAPTTAPHTNASHPPPPPAATAHPAAPATSGHPGMLAQMAATAGSVAVGSTIGHGISSMLFGGGGSSHPVEQQAAPAQSVPTNQAQWQGGLDCGTKAKEFTQCLENSNSDMNACSWYLEQLKACQAAASKF